MNKRDPFLLGTIAASNKLSKNKNPYRKNSIFFKKWNSGWEYYYLKNPNKNEIPRVK